MTFSSFKVLPSVYLYAVQC